MSPISVLVFMCVIAPIAGMPRVLQLSQEDPEYFYLTGLDGGVSLCLHEMEL